VGKERVRVLMQRHGIKAKGEEEVRRDHRQQASSAGGARSGAAALQPEAPNVLWSGDITYMPTDEGWLYLAAVLDLHSRQVVGWSMQPHMQPAGQGRLADGLLPAQASSARG
jgi:putative transposase